MYIPHRVAGIKVLVENNNVMDWFNAANVTDEKEYTDVILTKKNTTQIEVTFKSGRNLCLF